MKMWGLNSRFYSFPVQFPFGREYPGLNGACFALSCIPIGILLGILLGFMIKWL